MSNKRIEIVSKIEEYIKNNIDRDISLKDISDNIGYSSFYLCKVFKDEIGTSIFNYIRKIKMSKNDLVLRDSNVKIIDLSFDSNFQSQEGFTRAFKKEFGISPGKYSKAPIPIKLFTAYPSKDKYNYYNNKGDKTMKESFKTVFVEIVERPKRKAIIKRAKSGCDYFEYAESLGCNEWQAIWGTLLSINGAIDRPCGMWLPKKFIDKNTSSYVQGVEVPYDYSGEIPHGFDVIELETCSYIKFISETFKDENFSEAVEYVQEAIKHYKPETKNCSYCFDTNPRIQFEPSGDIGYAEMCPVVKKK